MTIPRAITPTELAYLRRDNQWSELFLHVDAPATVYTARLNGAPASTNKVVEITYDGGSGTLGNVLPGMTLAVGSAAGASEKGLCRIRAVPGAAKFYLGETSEIAWADNDYLTVLDEFGLWPRHVGQVGLDTYVDYNIACRTGLQCAPQVHTGLGTDKIHGTVRMSVGPFNTEEHIDKAIEEVREIAKIRK